MKPAKPLKQLLQENRDGFRKAEEIRRQLREGFRKAEEICRQLRARIHQEVWGDTPLQPMAKQQVDRPPQAAETLNKRFWDFL